MNFLGKALAALIVCTIGACSGSRGGSENSEKVATTSQPVNTLCLLGGTCTLVMPIPQGSTAQSVVLSATTALTVSNGATVATDSGGSGTIANLGGLVTSVGIRNRRKYCQPTERDAGHESSC
jgi:hypothetical protein